MYLSKLSHVFLGWVDGSLGRRAGVGFEGEAANIQSSWGDQLRTLLPNFSPIGWPKTIESRSFFISFNFMILSMAFNIPILNIATLRLARVNVDCPWFLITNLKLNIFVSVFSPQICWDFWLIIRKLWDGAVCDHCCNKSRWVLKLCGKTCTRQWGFSDASSEPEGWSEKKNNSWIEISSWKSYFPDLVDLNSSCLLFSLASPQGVKVTLTVFTFKVWTFPRSALEWIWLRHSACSECHFILKHRNTSYNWSDKDKDKECHFILVVLQYILQLVGSRCRL